MQVNGIGWTGVLTEHFESTLSFFSDVLGLHMAYRDESKELAHFRFRSGQLLEIYGLSNRARKEKYRWFQGPALGFEVEDVASARQEMLARGACFITELESWENEVWTMFLGPENRLFEIASPRGAQPGTPPVSWGFAARAFAWRILPPRFHFSPKSWTCP